ncbi:MAG: GFA family protein [Myxococcota bacterium]
MSTEERFHQATCDCGRLQVRIRGALPASSLCHCFACQRRTGSVFGAQVRVAKHRVERSGTSTVYVRRGDSGGVVEQHFCPTCGSTVFWTVDGLPDSVIVASGAFADPDLPAPTFSVYRARKHPWVTLPASVVDDWE